MFGHGFATKLSSAGLVYKHYGRRSWRPPWAPRSTRPTWRRCTSPCTAASWRPSTRSTTVRPGFEGFGWGRRRQAGGHVVAAQLGGGGQTRLLQEGLCCGFRVYGLWFMVYGWGSGAPCGGVALTSGGTARHRINCRPPCPTTYTRTAGINAWEGDAPPRYLNNTHLSARVGNLNPQWNEPQGGASSITG